MERLKTKSYKRIFTNDYFWRTYDRQEIDLIEERDGKLYAYEFKWNPKAKSKHPKLFLEAYPESKFTIIHRDNIEEFLFNAS